MTTQERLHELFRYEDGNLIRKIARPLSPEGSIVGTVNGPEGRLTVTVDGRAYLVHRLIFLMHHGYLPKLIDHIDGNPRNNRIENLREATHGQNIQNSRKHRDARTSRFKGVHYDPKRGTWRAQCKVNGRQVTLGRFESEIEAALAYDVAAYKQYGEYARLNQYA